MKFGVTILLVACSLSLRGENTNGAAKPDTNAGLFSTPILNLAGKPSWLSESDWETAVSGNYSNIAGNPPAIALMPPGTSPWNADSTLSGGDALSLLDEARIEQVLRKSEPLDGLRLGENDYVFRSPILEGLVPRPLPDDASLGEKLLNLPVVRLLRPLPMAYPPGGGKYFKWGSRDRAWTEYNQPVSGPGRADNGM